MLQEMGCQLDCWQFCSVWWHTRLIPALRGGRCRFPFYLNVYPFLFVALLKHMAEKKKQNLALTWLHLIVYARWHTCTITITALANVLIASKQRGICPWIIHEATEDIRGILDLHVFIFKCERGSRHYTLLCLKRWHIVSSVSLLSGKTWGN